MRGILNAGIALAAAGIIGLVLASLICLIEIGVEKIKAGRRASGSGSKF